MSLNVGGIDRAARIIIGTVLLLISMTTNSIGLWGVLGMIPIVSGFMRYCPLYSLLGVSTRPAVA
jgi:membrane-bound ClpP family serine protease